MKKIWMICVVCLLTAPLFSQMINFDVEIKYKIKDSTKTGEITITVISGQPGYTYYITTHDPVKGKVLYQSDKTSKKQHTFRDVKPGTYIIKIQDSTGMFAGKSIVIEN